MKKLILFLLIFPCFIQCSDKTKILPESTENIDLNAKIDICNIVEYYIKDMPSNFDSTYYYHFGWIVKIPYIDGVYKNYCLWPCGSHPTIIFSQKTDSILIDTSCFEIPSICLNREYEFTAVVNIYRRGSQGTISKVLYKSEQTGLTGLQNKFERVTIELPELE